MAFEPTAILSVCASKLAPPPASLAAQQLGPLGGKKEDLMKINYRNDNGTVEAQISDQADWDLFERVAALIENEFKGHWSTKLDGIDQRYWDLKIGPNIITLHLEHFLGISIYPGKENNGICQANQLVEKIGEFLEGKPPNQ